jgi:hypothetical protein
MPQAQPLHRPAAGLSSIENRASVGQLGNAERERPGIVRDGGNTLTRRAAKDINPVRWQSRALVAPCLLYPRKRTCAVH